MDSGSVPQNIGRHESPLGGWRPLPGLPGEWRPLNSGPGTAGPFHRDLDFCADHDGDPSTDPDLDLYLDPDHGLPPGSDGSLTDELIAGS